MEGLEYHHVPGTGTTSTGKMAMALGVTDTLEKAYDSVCHSDPHRTIENSNEYHRDTAERQEYHCDLEMALSSTEKLFCPWESLKT